MRPIPTIEPPFSNSSSSSRKSPRKRFLSREYHVKAISLTLRMGGKILPQKEERLQVCFGLEITNLMRFGLFFQFPPNIV